MRLLAHPFRLAGDGTAATVEQGSDAATAQALGALVATVRGERDDVPAFGVTDPTFGALDLAEVIAGVALFGPAVEITGLTSDYVDDQTQRVVLTWQTPEATT